MLAPLAPQPAPRMAALQLAKRRPRARRRPVLRPRLPVGQIPQAEVMGLAAHDGESHRDRRGGSQPLGMVAVL
jgi:hypothetical protein